MARFASGTGTVFLGSTLVGYIVLLGDAKVATALAHLERVWVNCRSELSRQAAPNRVA